MADTCQYHAGGTRVHDAAAAQAVLGTRTQHSGGWEIRWSLYDATTEPSDYRPEFCLGHAEDVMTARQQRSEQAVDATAVARKET